MRPRPDPIGEYHNFRKIDGWRDPSKIPPAVTRKVDEIWEQLDMDNVTTAAQLARKIQDDLPGLLPGVEKYQEAGRKMREAMRRNMELDAQFHSAVLPSAQRRIERELGESWQEFRHWAEVQKKLKELAEYDPEKFANELLYRWLGRNGPKLDVDNFAVDVMGLEYLPAPLRGKWNRVMDRFGDWWAKNMKEYPDNPMVIDVGGSHARAYHSRGKIKLSDKIIDGYTDDELLKTIIHEAGHYLEWIELRETGYVRAADFLWSRTKGKKVKSRGRPFASSEEVLEDKFPDDYVGRYYHGTEPWDRVANNEMFSWNYVDPWTRKKYEHLGPDWASKIDELNVPVLYGTEITSMGMEYIMGNPAKFLKDDPEYFIHLIDTLLGRAP